MTLPPASRGPITDSPAPTPSPVQNGRDPSTPSSWPTAVLREHTSVSRPALNPASDADLPALIWAGSAGASTALSGPRWLPLDAGGSYPLVPPADGRLWKYCGSGLPLLSVNSWPISLLPTGFPLTVTIAPSALSCSPGSRAPAQMPSG